MSKLTDPWHFPRPDLAQAYLRGFDLGLTSARGLFARRLTGAKLQLMARVDHGTYRFEDPEFQSWVAARRTVD